MGYVPISKEDYIKKERLLHRSQFTVPHRKRRKLYAHASGVHLAARKPTTSSWGAWMYCVYLVPVQ